MKCKNIRTHLPISVMEMVHMKCSIHKECQRQLKIVQIVEACKLEWEFHDFRHSPYKFSTYPYQVLIEQDSECLQYINLSEMIANRWGQYMKVCFKFRNNIIINIFYYFTKKKLSLLYVVWKLLPHDSVAEECNIWQH